MEKKWNVLLRVIAIALVLGSTLVGGNQFVVTKIYYVALAVPWFFGDMLNLSFKDNQKGLNVSSVILGMMSFICFFCFIAWSVLSLVGKFGGYDWLMQYHMTIEDLFPGYWTTAVSWPAFFAGTIFMLFSCITGALPEAKLEPRKEEDLNAEIQ